jgi:hypothetical protein
MPQQRSTQLAALVGSLVSLSYQPTDLQVDTLMDHDTDCVS